MVSHEELIYHFTDIYLKTAVQCSICKENYELKDDTYFLDEFMRFFVSLLYAVEENPDLTIEDVKKVLEKQKEKILNRFRLFFMHKITEECSEKIYENFKINMLGGTLQPSKYAEKLTAINQAVFDNAEEPLPEEPVEFFRKLLEKKDELV